MKIVDILNFRVPLSGQISNAVVNFSEHDVSLVAVVSDLRRNGRPLVGWAFNSIGRFAQQGIIEQRIRPRILAATEKSLLDCEGKGFDPSAVRACAMQNEKPGGHGDRASAVAAVELAIWDLNAKIREVPAWVLIAEHFGCIEAGCIEAGRTETVRTGAGRTEATRAASVYAAGGYYYPPGVGKTLSEELKSYQAMGFDRFKIKVGGAQLREDLARIDAAMKIAGDGKNLLVDANGRFDLPGALAFAKEIAPYSLGWFEEAGDPLDYALNRSLAEHYAGPIATGENLFSFEDVRNLLRYGGQRAGRDIFQMDAGLSYGLTDYARMIALMEQHGFDRRQAWPHGGHLINLHIVVGLGLGGCEVYPCVFQPFGGYSDACRIANGQVTPSQAPGFGLEEKSSLKPWLEKV
ncbi:Putative mandelate racemase [gamma proteobacterium HdN1]|nr:Putative mandelate racemase [gamma proteobacterium HdN1]